MVFIRATSLTREDSVISEFLLDNTSALTISIAIFGESAPTSFTSALTMAWVDRRREKLLKQPLSKLSQG